MKKRVFEIKVPATTANLGPGFDSLGLAMRIYNRVTVTIGGEEGMEIEGFGADELPRDESNLMVNSAMALAEREGQALPAMHWKAQHDIPLARGMGSSSAAIVAGLMAADAALGLRTSRGVLTHLAADIEGHPDNVAPALVGGLTICMPGSEPMEVVRVRPLEALRLALLVPDYQLSTESMRRVLPREVAFVDAVFNLSRSAAMVAALEHGLWSTLKEACRDRLHQPQRMELMGCMKAIFAAAYEAGAHGVAVSGSGPTAVAFCTDRADEAAQAMLEAAKGAGVDAETRVTQPDLDGATVTQRE